MITINKRAINELTYVLYIIGERIDFRSFLFVVIH